MSGARSRAAAKAARKRWAELAPDERAAATAAATAAAAAQRAVKRDEREAALLAAAELTVQRAPAHILWRAKRIAGTEDVLRLARQCQLLIAAEQEADAALLAAYLKEKEADDRRQAERGRTRHRSDPEARKRRHDEGSPGGA